MTGQEQGSQPRPRRPDSPLRNYAMAEKTAQADKAVTNYYRGTITPHSPGNQSPNSTLGPYVSASLICSLGRRLLQAMLPSISGKVRIRVL